MNIWQRKGLLVTPDILPEWARAKSFMQHPTATMVDDKILRVYYAARDEENRSQVMSVDLDSAFKVVGTEERILPLGGPGTFDEFGIMPSQVIRIRERDHLYYIGISRDAKYPFRNAIGLAIDVDGGYEKIKGPILDRQRKSPLFASCPWVRRLGPSSYVMYFLSGTKWEIEGDKLRAYYDIKQAFSSDGVDWRDIISSIPLIDGECAIARPQFIGDGDQGYLLFCSRWDKYHIGMAQIGDDLYSTERLDFQLLGTPEGWEVEMQCYPNYVKTPWGEFLLYNGNGYGITGIGVAEKVV